MLSTKLMLGAILRVMRTSQAAVDAGSSQTIVPLESRRRERAKLVQKLQHILPSVFLLTDGVRRLGGERSPWLLALGAAEVVTSVLVLGAFARAIRRTRSSSNTTVADAHATHGVDWVDIFLGGMLLTEALVHRQETGHLPRPTVLLAATVVVLGLLHGRLRERGLRRRAILLTDAGISIGGRWGSRLEATWAEIDRIDVTSTDALIVTRSGRQRRIDLTDARNAMAITEALTVARDRLANYQKQLQGVTTG